MHRWSNIENPNLWPNGVNLSQVYIKGTYNFTSVDKIENLPFLLLIKLRIFPLCREDHKSPTVFNLDCACSKDKLIRANVGERALEIEFSSQTVFC